MAKYLSDWRTGSTKQIKIDYGTGVDITGWQFYLLLKKDFTSTKIDYTFTTTAGDNVLDDVLNGLCYLTVPSDATVKPGKYHYVVKVNKGGSPAVVKVIIPPIGEAKEKVEIFQGM